jgi:hypothetical protein
MRFRPITYKEFLNLGEWRSKVYIQTPAKRKMVEVIFLGKALKTPRLSQFLGEVFPLELGP